MNYALIGCGRISKKHIQAAIENRLNIVALCDIDVQKTDKLVEAMHLSKNIRRYADYKEMLEKEKVELVAIATESGKHAEIAINCIEKNVNVIIEKPIALSIQDADEIIKCSEDAGVKVCVCHQNRFNKSILKIREAIDENRFGKLLYGTARILWNRAPSYYKQALWRGTWEQDGGALMNQCIHNIDILRWMMGEEVSELMAYTDNLMHDFIEVEDFGIAIIKFKNGAYGVIEGTTDIYPENFEETLSIFGERGTVKAGGKSLNILEHWEFADNLVEGAEVKKLCREEPENIYGFGHSRLYLNMIEAIKNDKRPYADAYAGRQALELVLAIYKSAATGEVVRFPIDKCRTIDFKGRFNYGI